ncbi:MAG: zinc ABC transporter substrate-binding protein [Ruminococcaceae bacterium]|nr:zinc ABC transporter substrate-binding protein [Oscillospiraceae bacterium]
MHFFKIRKYTAIILIGLNLMLSGCGSAPMPESDKLRVVCIIYPQYDLARAIGKEMADVQMIMKPGAEVHGFEPSAADIRLISEADVLVCGGGESDVWIDSILESISHKPETIVHLMDHAELLEEENPSFGSSHTHSHDHSHNEECETHGHLGFDEHIWLNPNNAISCVNAICDAMSKADTKNKDIYRANADEYIKKIEEADAEIEMAVDGGKTNFIAVGDRFPYLYLTKRYGLSYAAVFSGCSPENDANPSVILKMIETMKEKNTKVVFFTELSDKKMARTISEETGAEMMLLHSCQSISKTDFENGKTYVDYMKENAKALKEALS